MRWRKLIKDNQKNFSRLHMLIDVFVVTVSYALAWLIRFQGIFEHSAVQSKTVQEYMFMLIFIIPGYLLLYQAFDPLYTDADAGASSRARRNCEGECVRAPYHHVYTL